MVGQGANERIVPTGSTAWYGDAISLAEQGWRIHGVVTPPPA